MHSDAVLFLQNKEMKELDKIWYWEKSDFKYSRFEQHLWTFYFYPNILFYFSEEVQPTCKKWEEK